MSARLLAASALASLLLGGCHGGRVVPEAEMRALLSGATVGGYHERWDYQFRRHYDADGTFEQVHGPAGHGLWWISEGKICIRWLVRPRNAPTQDLCRTMYTDDVGNYWKSSWRRRIVSYDWFESGIERRIEGGIE